MGVITMGVLGAVGLAGGIMGGMQKGKQQEAAYQQQKAQVAEQNFVNAMAHDRQTEAVAQSNVNSRIKDQNITQAAIENKFYSNYDNMQKTQDGREQIYQSSRAAQATATSQAAGQGSSGGSAAAISRQQLETERKQTHQLNMASFEQSENIQRNFENTLATRNMGVGAANTQAYIPGSGGVQPDSSGAMIEGIFGGVSAGLGMASGVKGLGS